jgi:DNA primase
MKQYVQTDLEADRQVANTLAELIIGGSLASFEMTSGARGLQISLQTTSERPLLCSRKGLWPW